MDIDLSNFYDEDGETYDTPCQIKELSSSFTQHQSTPTLQSLPLQCNQNIHNSAPNLENDVNNCNLLFKNGNDLPANIWHETESFDHGFYMNTSLHAESRSISTKNSLVEINDPSKNVSPQNTSKGENVKLLNEAVTFQTEEYYMAPPSISSNDALNMPHAFEKEIESQENENVFYDEPLKLEETHRSLPAILSSMNDNTTERNLFVEENIGSQNIQTFYDEPSKLDKSNVALSASLSDHTIKTTLVADKQISSHENAFVLYDEPAKIESNHGSLPPLPTTEEIHANGHLDTEHPDESFYEGINDNAISDFYEGLGDDNFYEGLENQKEFYSSQGDTDMNDFYEGIGDVEIYEGLDDNNERNLSSSTHEDVSLKCLIDSLGETDTPYIPPKPPPVPFRNPSKAFKPLPDIPQYQLFDPLINYVKMSPTTEDGPCLSPIIKEVAQSKSLVDVTSKISSASPQEPSLSSVSSEGLYDGIEMGSEDFDTDESDENGHKVPQMKNGMRRSYSVNFKNSVEKTRNKTAQHLGQWKQSISHTLSSRKSKWKESQTRTDIKTVFKETRTKANELKGNTETMYNVLQRRASKSWKKKSRSKHRKSNSGEEEDEAIEVETSQELEEAASKSEEFKSFVVNTENIASSAGSKYFDLEASGSSDRRSSSLTSESHVRVRSVHSGISSHADNSAYPDMPDQLDNSMLVFDPGRKLSVDTSLHEEGYTDDGAAAVSGAGVVSFNGIAIPPEVTSRGAAVNSHLSYTVTDRHKVLQQILDHEYRYIMSLKDMMKVYAAPLQHSQANKSLLDPAKAQEIFFRIPEITVHHEFFYEQLRRRSMTWSKHQSLGDILLQLFHKPGLFSAYASYMDNFNHALEIVLDARAARPAFSKFLDKLRSKSNQLSLEDLIYLPVDHIPVYLELVQELIKQTTQDDPDYTYLYLAKDEITKLIEKLNERKHQAEKSFSVKLLEKKIIGLPCSLIAPQRYIINVERVRELDIMTERSDDRHLVILSDIIVCLKPLNRATSTNVISTSTAAEYQYLWDSLISDIHLDIDSDSVKHIDEETVEDQDGYQALKDDLMIIEQIDGLRKQLKSSYTSVRFDKLADVQVRLRKEIAERQSSEESRRGKTLKVTRPVNSPCTSTQFHQFLFSTVAARSHWCANFLQRQQLINHTRGLDWCQVGETEVIPQDRLATLLPIIKHMTPIGFTTPTLFSVECAAANADFTCPVTQDILYRIMSKGDEPYANSDDLDEIPILPPDTPLYDEDLALPQAAPQSTDPIPSQPPNIPDHSVHVFPLPVINPEVHPDSSRKSGVPSVITSHSRSPYAVNNAGGPPPLPGRSVSIDTSSHPSSLLIPQGANRSSSFDSAIQNMMAPPPLPGNHPMGDLQPQHRSTIIEMIENVPKEFDIDDKETVDDIYETPYEISLLREEKKKLMRSLSVDDGIPESSQDTAEPEEAGGNTDVPHSVEETELTSSVSEDQDRPWIDSIDMSSLDYPSLPSLPSDQPGLQHAPQLELTLASLQSLPEDDPVCPLESTPPPEGAKLTTLNRLDHMNLSEFPDHSFNLELTDSKALDSFIAPRNTLSSTTRSDSAEPLLVDRYGQVYTDKITSLISGPGTGEQEVPLPPDLDKKSMDLSLIELDSEDEDDTPNMYDSQLNLLNLPPQESMGTGTLSGITPINSLQHHSRTSTTLSGNDSTNPPSLSTDTPVSPGLPNIIVPTSELEIDTDRNNDSLYENVASSTQKLRTKVIRRESSKRSLTRSPFASSRISLLSEDWQDQDPYENLQEENAQFELKPTDVFLCGHGQNGTGEIVVLRLTEPTPHIALNIPLKSSQVLSCHMVPGSKNTLWVGTQDARLLVYQMADPSSSLRELDLEGGSVICISHLGDSVFVGTSEGMLHVFTRDATVNEWCENDPISKKLGGSSICTMLPIGDHMWCSCGSQIFVISPRNVTVEHLFSTHNNTSAQVYKMVNSGSGVWLAIRNSPVIRLFHAKTGEHLEDYDISTVVHHLFTGSLSASQRRRAENVRVTALLASASTGALWIGTSSGVIVVVPISKPPMAPKVSGPPFLSYMGHYDGVRFLMQAQSRVKKFIARNEEETVFEETTSQVVISCGKGMEDFRDLTTTAQSEPKKRTESQNSSYLVVWHYPAFEEST